MKQQLLTWEKIADRLPSVHEETGCMPPFGFAARIVAHWQASRRDRSLRRWTLWSFRAAMASMAACALLATAQSLREKSILLPLPEFPAPNELPTRP
jgi:hypothetical protein